MSPGIKRSSGASIKLVYGGDRERELARLAAKASANSYALKDKARRQLSVEEVRKIRAAEPRSQMAKVLSEFEPSDLAGRIIFWFARKFDDLRWKWEQRRFR
jgi:hypothetical protein